MVPKVLPSPSPALKDSPWTTEATSQHEAPGPIPTCLSPAGRAPRAGHATLTPQGSWQCLWLSCSGAQRGRQARSELTDSPTAKPLTPPQAPSQLSPLFPQRKQRSPRPTPAAASPGPPPSCVLLRSKASPLARGLVPGAVAGVARGRRFPGTFTVVRSRSISLPWMFCM